MKHIILALALVALHACASASSTYLGNGLHEINAKGSGPTVSAESVREAFVKKAFETCAEEGKGFEILADQDTSVHGMTANTTGNANTNVYGGSNTAYANTTYSSQTSMIPTTKQRTRTVIRCTGEMDTVLLKKYRPAAETGPAPASTK